MLCCLVRELTIEYEYEYEYEYEKAWKTLAVWWHHHLLVSYRQKIHDE